MVAVACVTDDVGNMPLKFIDLFAGIGGTRLAFENAGMVCAFSSEKDRFSRTTYQANHHDLPHGDITEIQKDRQKAGWSPLPASGGCVMAAGGLL